MSCRKIIKSSAAVILFTLYHGSAFAVDPINLCEAPLVPHQNRTTAMIAKSLGWVETDENRCGGYYQEAPFVLPQDVIDPSQLKVTGQTGLFSLHGTSTYEGNVTISQNGQQLITNHAYVHRNPATEAYSAIDLNGEVTFREPSNLIQATCGHINLENNEKILRDILYRIAIYSPLSTKPARPSGTALQAENKVYQLSAWGEAKTFQQQQPKVYQFTSASYTTCPPLMNSWHVEAEEIILDKENGHGKARKAKLYVKSIPVFYAPYLNFPIDMRRQSGFLWPTIGSSSVSGPSISVPFYWNMAPNYDDTITPSLQGRRGLQINNLFRFLKETPRSAGQIEISILPNDALFADFKTSQAEENANSNNEVTQAELNRLENSSTTRNAIYLQNKTYFNDNWSGDINYNYVSDDYYLKDFNNNLTGITPNQLLQQGDIYYKGEFWNFTGRIQAYQTLHPIGNVFYNQYIRLPELKLNGIYPDPNTGFTFTLINEFTRFDIEKNPANENPNGLQILPIGDRIQLQPGINFPFYRLGFYMVPRLQMALTQYELRNVINENDKNPGRALPIFDVSSGLFFDRNVSLFNTKLLQTFEPQLYYTYIPYRNQNEFPIFDTTETTLTYDQLFTYNRFTSWDRIGDANQIAIGLATRFIDQETGYQKASAGIGQIYYFADRLVTLCQAGEDCEDDELPHNNTTDRSPLSAVFNVNLAPHWAMSANSIWNPGTRHIDNQTVTLQYARDSKRLVGLSYSYVRNSDLSLSDIPANNLSQTDFTFSWPLSRDWSTVGRWTEDWNQTRFHNLLYGLQYDTCCWAIRLVAGRTFDSLIDNEYQYNTEIFIQFALKGLGSFGSGNPGRALNNSLIASESSFGQDF